MAKDLIVRNYSTELVNYDLLKKFLKEEKKEEESKEKKEEVKKNVIELGYLPEA